MSQPMRDPSDGIDKQLLHHVHLVSANQYPNQARLDLQHVSKYLMAAPQVAKDKAPFFWTYLNQPNPGTVIMTWQPLSKIGTNYSSDGYIWAPEQYHRSDVGNGLMMEVYYNRTGFKPGEQHATYARRRFRLIPSQTGNPNVPQIDINLWIVHYAMAEQPDQVPTSVVPYPPETQNVMSQRNYLQSCGSIARKDFMLSDRGNWPHISWPRTGAAQQPIYAPIQSRRMPQQAAYPPGGPQSGRRGRGQAQAQQAQGHAQLEFAEDELNQDVFDILTPRDIALSRYQQNHEWMEEIISSPYPIYHISPPDLGLGLKGELGALTDGFFAAQAGEAVREYPENAYTGQLDAGLAEEFKKRAEEHIASTNAEIEKMKAEHASAMAAFKSNSFINHAEKDLRLSVEERGSEIWRLEGRTFEGEDGGGWSQKHNKKVDDIVAQVEAHYGRQIAVLRNVNRVQDGGYQEPAPEPVKEPSPVQQSTAVPPPAGGLSAEALSRRPSQAGSQNSGMMEDTDMDMGGTAAGLLDQMHTGFSATSTPLNNFPTPQANISGLNSSAATPTNANAQSPAPNPPAGSSETSKKQEQDVTMGNTEAVKEPSPKAEEGAAGEDWVVVPKGGVSPDAAAGQQPSKPAVPAVAARQGSAAGTPAVTEGDANDFSSLGDLDTAGDALATYGTPDLDGGAGSLGDGLDLHMEMDDSAFGDAFHGVSNTGTPAESQSEGV